MARNAISSVTRVALLLSVAAVAGCETTGDPNTTGGILTNRFSREKAEGRLQDRRRAIEAAKGTEGSFLAENDRLAAELPRRRAELAVLEARIAEVRSGSAEVARRVEEARKTFVGLRAELESLETEREKLERANASVRDRAELPQRLAELQQRRERLAEDIGAAREEVEFLSSLE